MDPVTLATAGVGLYQTIDGIIGKKSSQKKMDALMSQIKGFKTPTEIYQALNATEANASFGLPNELKDFLSSENDAGFAASLEMVQRLGGDPMAMSAIFGQKQNKDGQIVAMDLQERMKKFTNYVQALNTMGANKAAEQKSQQDILRDKLQATGADLTAQAGNTQSGLNALISAFSAQGMMDGWTDDQKKTKVQKLGAGTLASTGVSLGTNTLAAPTGGSYIDPNMVNPQRLFKNPFK